MGEIDIEKMKRLLQWFRERLVAIKNWIFDKVINTKGGYFVVGLVIGSTLIFIFLVGKPFYQEMSEGYDIATEILIRESTQVVPQEDGLVKEKSEAVPQEKSEVSLRDIEGLITRYFGEDSQTALAVAKAESRLNPQAKNINTNGSVDCGIFQINSVHKPTKEQCENAEENIKLAHKIYSKSGFIPWTAYKSGSYKKFLN